MRNPSRDRPMPWVVSMSDGVRATSPAHFSASGRNSRTIGTITEAPLVLEDLLAIADGARVELAAGVREALTASRAVVDDSLSRNEAVYGLTTQVGHGKDTR